MTAAHIKPAPSPEPYAVVYLPELVNGTADKQMLMLPLTFVYLLSMHVHFVLPVSSAAVPLVDAILDEVLAGHSLESKGISYIEAGASMAESLRSATLLVTTHTGADVAASVEELPAAMMFTPEGKGPHIRLRNTEKIADESLKAKLVGCAQLINIQSGGFMSEGHFSLSW